MAAPVELAQSRTFPFPVEKAFAFTLSAPLPAIFRQWWGPLPPITDVTGPESWGTVGQTRVIRTADGATMHEELLTVEAPDRFAYELTEVTGALKYLFASVDGSWSFAAVGTGTGVIPRGGTTITGQAAWRSTARATPPMCPRGSRCSRRASTSRDDSSESSTSARAGFMWWMVIVCSTSGPSAETRSSAASSFSVASRATCSRSSGVATSPS